MQYNYVQLKCNCLLYIDLLLKFAQETRRFTNTDGSNYLLCPRDERHLPKNLTWRHLIIAADCYSS